MGLKRTIQKCALWAVLMLASQAVSAQNEVQFSDYTRLKSYYNPAVSGTEGKLNVVAAYSMQFVGFEDAPKTMYVGADLPIFFLGPRHGAGASLSDIKVDFPATDYVGNQHYVFNIRGNKYRLIVVVKFTIGHIFIRFVGTHSEYDKIDASTI